MVQKKILILSTGDVNGAYEAMYKVAQILIKAKHEVVLCVKHKTKSDNFIKQYQHKPIQKTISFSERLYQKCKRKIQPTKTITPLKDDPKYSFISINENQENIVVEDFLNTVGFMPDIIITGMTTWFINSTDLKNLYNATRAKIYNITVDMNHFTGGCHFAWDCNGYIKGCDINCPAILSPEHKELAQHNFSTKYENAKIANFQIIAGSGLTLQQAKVSKIYKDQKTIYNLNSLIDTTLLNPKNRSIAKQIFGFEHDKFYVLCGAQNMNDPRKGFSYFLEAIKLLEHKLTPTQKEKVVILVVSNEISNDFETLPFEKQKIDYIKDYRLLSLLYQSINLYVNSSIEDSGPMMVSEALACGTPVVGFNTGILINMIEDGKNGFKVDVGNSDMLAEGIKKIIELTPSQYQSYSDYAVKMVENYSSYHYASKIFKKIINQND